MVWAGNTVGCTGWTGCVGCIIDGGSSWVCSCCSCTFGVYTGVVSAGVNSKLNPPCWLWVWFPEVFPPKNSSSMKLACLTCWADCFVGDVVFGYIFLGWGFTSLGAIFSKGFLSSASFYFSFGLGLISSLPHILPFDSSFLYLERVEELLPYSP